jgi:hypothetical protein
LAEPTNPTEKCRYFGRFRLPNGAFAGTQVGTDIIILKNSQKISTDISNYFEKIRKNFGETREKPIVLDDWKTMFMEI